MMLVEKAEEITAFCESTDESVGLLLDTGHAYAAGADHGEILAKIWKANRAHSSQGRAS